MYFYQRDVAMYRIYKSNVLSRCRDSKCHCQAWPTAAPYDSYSPFTILIPTIAVIFSRPPANLDL